MNVTTKSDTLETPLSEAATDADKVETWGSFGLFLLKLLLAVLVFRSFIFSPFSIPSESMLPRLWNGDYLLAAKWPYGYSRHSLPYSVPLIPGRILASQPEAGDIVIFKHPIDQKDYIKRVIALPGDTVGVIGGQIVLNGQLVPREEIGEFEIPVSENTSCAWGAEASENGEGKPVCRYRQFRETLPNGRSYDVLDFGLTDADSFEPVMVPEGRMFVMGDNRDNSEDSRFRAAEGGGVGLVPQELLVGEASIVMWSTDGSAEWIKPWTWFTAARWDRLGETL
ncbi:MAG: signal peptidase I [Erythrobacter sp.]|nr:signal peptidase I [Erythrobacter sp.]